MTVEQGRRAVQRFRAHVGKRQHERRRWPVACIRRRKRRTMLASSARPERDRICGRPRRSRARRLSDHYGPPAPQRAALRRQNAAARPPASLGRRHRRRTTANRPNPAPATPSERSHHGADHRRECPDAASAPGYAARLRTAAAQATSATPLDFLQNLFPLASENGSIRTAHSRAVPPGMRTG